MLTVLAVLCALLAFVVYELFLTRLRLKLAHAREEALLALAGALANMAVRMDTLEKERFDPEATQDREVQP